MEPNDRDLCRQILRELGRICPGRESLGISMIEMDPRALLEALRLVPDGAGEDGIGAAMVRVIGGEPDD